MIKYLLVFTLMFLYKSEHFAVVSTKLSCIRTPPQKSSPPEFVSFTFKNQTDNKELVPVCRIRGSIVSWLRIWAHTPPASPAQPTHC